MDKLPITSQHLAIADKIIAFVQAQGWDVNGLHISRYDEHRSPLFGTAEGEDWKAPVWKWSLNIEVGPRDDDTIRVPRKEPA